MTYGEKLRSFRKKNNLTQKALATQLGVSVTTVCAFENNRRKNCSRLIDNAEKLMNLNGCSLYEHAFFKAPIGALGHGEWRKEQKFKEIGITLG